MYLKNEIRGIWFLDGSVTVAKVMEETDHFLVVENMLLLIAQEVPADVDPESGRPNRMKTQIHFDDMMPFADIVKTGLDTKIPQSAIRFTFKLPRDLETGYKQRTSLLNMV